MIRQPSLALRVLVAVLALLAVSGHSSAHSFYLDARLQPGEEGDALVVDVQVGHALRGEVLPRMEHHIDRFALLEPDGTERPLLGADGRAPAGVATDVGTPALVLYESRGVRHTMTRADFEVYAREEGLTHLLGALDPAPGGFESETYHRCAKAVVGPILPSSPANRLARRASGCTLDLVLVETVGPGEGLQARFRLLLRGEPLPLALVRATSETAGREVELRTDERGEVAVSLDGGRWMLSAVHLEHSSGRSPERETDGTRWRSWWSSLVLDVGRAAEPGAAATG